MKSLILAILPVVMLAQSNLQSPATAKRRVGAAGELCAEHTDGTSECIKGAANGWIPQSGVMDLGETGTRFRDGWFSRDVAVAGTATIGTLSVTTACTGVGCTQWTDTSSTYLAPTSDRNVEPKTNNTSTLGSTSRRWSTIYGVNANLTGDLLADELGQSGSRITKLWVTDIDCSGTCLGSSYWSRNSGSGYIYPATTTDDVRVKNKIQFEDNSGGASGLVFDAQATVTLASPGTRYLEFRDNAGVTMLKLQRQAVGAVDEKAVFDLAIVPSSNNTRSVGVSGNQFQHGWFGTVHTSTISGPGGFVQVSTLSMEDSTTNIGDITTPVDYVYTNNIGDSSNPASFVHVTSLAVSAMESFGGGSSIAFYDHLIPDATNTRDIGASGTRTRKIWTVDLDVSGTCTGCSGLFTDSGSDTYLTSTGDNLAIGSTSASGYKLHVTGSTYTSVNATIGGTLFCDSDAGCNIGDDGAGNTSRPGSGYFATAVFTYNGGGSSTVRTSLSGSGLLVYNSSGTQVASVSGSTGRMSSNIGFTANGSNGLDVTKTVRASGGGSDCTLVFTGGILTGGTC